MVFTKTPPAFPWWMAQPPEAPSCLRTVPCHVPIPVPMLLSVPEVLSWDLGSPGAGVGPAGRLLARAAGGCFTLKQVW